MSMYGYRPDKNMLLEFTAHDRAIRATLCSLFIRWPSAPTTRGGTLLGNKKTGGLLWTFYRLRRSGIMRGFRTIASSGLADSRRSHTRFSIGRLYR